MLEIGLTFAAELLAPLLALLGGRRGRWLALLCWTALQVGIQLTCNFGWLNTAAIGLGLLLLDDQMIATAAGRLRRGAGTLFFRGPGGDASRARARGPGASPACAPRWGRISALRCSISPRPVGLSVDDVPPAIMWPVNFLGQFRSANGYYLYASFDAAHYQVDFEGSNDGGKTWRTYECRHVPQRVDRMPPFTAPWFARFEETIQIEGSRPSEVPFLPLVATRLLERNPDVTGRFERDPFPDRPPTVIRMRRLPARLHRPRDPPAHGALLAQGIRRRLHAAGVSGGAGGGRPIQPAGG